MFHFSGYCCCTYIVQNELFSENWDGVEELKRFVKSHWKHVPVKTEQVGLYKMENPIDEWNEWLDASDGLMWDFPKSQRIIFTSLFPSFSIWLVISDRHLFFWSPFTPYCMYRDLEDCLFFPTRNSPPLKNKGHPSLKGLDFGPMRWSYL